MRMLFLTNFYPPPDRGGYDQLCHDVGRELGARGHHLGVLTSRVAHRPSATQEDGAFVFRLLHEEVQGGLLRTTVRLLADRSRHARENVQYVESAVAAFRPDAALVWGMGNISRSVTSTLERALPHRVAYYLCDYWPSVTTAYYQKFASPSAWRLTRLPKRLLARAVLSHLAGEPATPLALEQPSCVSYWVRDRLVELGVSVGHARIIHNGIQPADFPFRPYRAGRRADEPLRLLYAGRLSAEKGVATAIRALGLLRDGRRATLDIVGGGDWYYERELKNSARRDASGSGIAFHPSVPRAKVPELLGRYDALLFPSEYEEPLARMPMESMAAGLVVIGTTTGGSGELLIEGRTALTFPAGDARALAAQIDFLVDEPELGTKLAHGGHQFVNEHFSLTSTVDSLESLLNSLVRTDVGCSLGASASGNHSQEGDVGGYRPAIHHPAIDTNSPVQHGR